MVWSVREGVLSEGATGGCPAQQVMCVSICGKGRHVVFGLLLTACPSGTCVSALYLPRTPPRVAADRPTLRSGGHEARALHGIHAPGRAMAAEKEGESQQNKRGVPAICSPKNQRAAQARPAAAGAV